MPRIEDYALIGDLQTAALVSHEGSVDWACFPRFDSGACFAALLGGSEHGRWQIAPSSGIRRSERRYRHDTLVLETYLEADEGAVRLIDFMPPRGKAPDIVRIIEGVRGRVPMRSELVIRYDYGTIVPWVQRVDDTRIAIAGPDALCFRTPIDVHGENMTTVGDFAVAAGDRVPFVLTWFPSHEQIPEEVDAEQALRDTVEYWNDWAARCDHAGSYHQDVHSSLLVLKALTYAPTGGIVAAPTTSLPEQIGGVRNWDYRFCWLRDATLTLVAMLNAGYKDEAIAWRDWLLRGIPSRPRRQRGIREASARRLRRGARRALRGAPARGTPEPAGVVDRPRDGHVARGRLAARGLRDLGGTRAAAPLHALEGDGLGRIRSRLPVHRALRLGGAARPLARGPRAGARRGA